MSWTMGPAPRNLEPVRPMGNSPSGDLTKITGSETEGLLARAIPPSNESRIP
jgi:hypothetical protein